MRTRNRQKNINHIIPYSKEEILRRLNKKSVDLNGHKIWTGSNSGRGHGEIRIGDVKYYVHRLAAWIFLDYDLNSNQQVNHKFTCKYKNCWNPECLYIGSQFNNMQDALKAGTHKMSNNRNKNED